MSWTPALLLVGATLLGVLWEVYPTQLVASHYDGVETAYDNLPRMALYLGGLSAKQLEQGVLELVGPRGFTAQAVSLPV